MPRDTEIELEQREATCIQCGNEFTTTVTRFAGRVMVGNVCTPCSRTSSEPQRPTDIPVALDRIGVNVRRHGAATTDSFDASSGALPLEAVREFVAEVIEGSKWSPVRSLMLCGNTGTGKTHLAVAAIQELIKQGERFDTMVFDRAARLITEIQDTYGTGGTAKVLERRERASLWVLDDLGSEKATQDSLRIIHDLIDAREGHPNIITSNFTPPQLGARYKNDPGWDRIASRLGTKNYRIVMVKGPDRRFAA